MTTRVFCNVISIKVVTGTRLLLMMLMKMMKMMKVKMMMMMTLFGIMAVIRVMAGLLALVNVQFAAHVGQYQIETFRAEQRSSSPASCAQRAAAAVVVVVVDTCRRLFRQRLVVTLILTTHCPVIFTQNDHRTNYDGPMLPTYVKYCHINYLLKSIARRGCKVRT